ncbi:MAG: purine-nucleoside phosphorylase [Solirubrobacteraceae bacterium]
MPPGTIHLRPTAPLAERVLLPGDPGRALALAQALLTEPRMFNHNRGLWGYTGAARDGELLTVQSTGMGGPSAAIVVEELATLGARRIVRVGTCGALRDDLFLGEVIVVREALPADGASRALGATGPVAADPELTAALHRAAEGAARTGAALTTDLFYDRNGERDAEGEGDWDASHAHPGERVGAALVAEMEAATVLRLGELLGLRAGCLLGVTDLRTDGHERMDDDALAVLGVRLGEIAARALF